MNLRFLMVLGLLVSGSGFGHARFKYIDPVEAKKLNPPPTTNFAPRNDSTGLKSPPCGGIPRTNLAKTFKPGEKVKVEWEETINHPGFFKISYSEKDDLDFKVLVPKFIDNQDEPILAANYHQFSTEITLPNIPCPACTLQIIQYMGPDETASQYFSCSDFILSNDAPATTPPAEGGATTPATIPTPDANVKPAIPKGVKVQKSK